jgi:hypothetical protein
MKKPPTPPEVASSFTVDWVREAIRSHAGRLCPPPDRELAQVACLLNMIDGAYKNSANLARAIEARYAFWALMHYFERGRVREKAVTEDELRDQFDGLVKAMGVSISRLDPGIGGLMRPYKSWHDFDHWIAHVFKMALEVGNPGKKIGFTNMGPVARLTAAAIEVITGKAPGVYRVGQHLKQPHKKKARPVEARV